MSNSSSSSSSHPRQAQWRRPSAQSPARQAPQQLLLLQLPPLLPRRQVGVLHRCRRPVALLRMLMCRVLHGTAMAWPVQWRYCHSWLTASLSAVLTVMPPAAAMALPRTMHMQHLDFPWRTVRSLRLDRLWLRMMRCWR